MIIIFDWTLLLCLYVTTTLFVKYYIDISICINESIKVEIWNYYEKV